MKTMHSGLIRRAHTNCKILASRSNTCLNPLLALCTSGLPREKSHFGGRGPRCSQGLIGSTMTQWAGAREALGKVEKKNGAVRLIIWAAERHNHRAEQSQLIYQKFSLKKRQSSEAGLLWGAGRHRGWTHIHTSEKLLFSLIIISVPSDYKRNLSLG